jgi:hypothetical protein
MTSNSNLISCDNSGDYFSQEELLVSGSQVRSPLRPLPFPPLFDLPYDVLKPFQEIDIQPPAPPSQILLDALPLITN